MVEKFFPKTTNMKQGQVLWITVHKDEKMSYGKSIQKTTLTNVVLDLVQEKDPLERAKRAINLRFYSTLRVSSDL